MNPPKTAYTSTNILLHNSTFVYTLLVYNTKIINFPNPKISLRIHPREDVTPNVA